VVAGTGTLGDLESSNGGSAARFQRRKHNFLLVGIQAFFWVGPKSGNMGKFGEFGGIWWFHEETTGF